MAIDILIAEDEPSILESLDFILRRAGWTISSVTDGDAVLGAVQRLKPRMVVLDVMLPKRSGFDVLKQIRANADLRAMPVLILTAKGQQQDRRTAEELGADGFVTKPYANAEVVGAVRQLLGEMADRHKLVSGMLVLTLFGALLLLPPLVYVFNQPISHFGVPQIVIYLFVIWLALIIGTALLTHALPPEESSPAEDD